MNPEVQRRLVARGVPLVPGNESEMARCLQEPLWRLGSGCLYKIRIKGDGDDNDDGLVVPFHPNAAQLRLIDRLWHRNLILKARQMGFTTLVSLMWLDHALFVANQRCAMVAQDRETADSIFRHKVKLAYQHLPAPLRERMPLARDSATELEFAHTGSSIRVATSVRGDTVHRLHVSEFGKVCAINPAKADEIMTGSIQAVPKTGITVVESTAEGRQGHFFNMVERAKAAYQQRKPLNPRQWRFHFYAWWMEPNYRLADSTAAITQTDSQYFDEVQDTTGIVITPAQRAWYVATRENDFNGAAEKMWQEYPSTPEEAFQATTEGLYYGQALVALRKRGGVCDIPVVSAPVYTFWDIGNSDGTAIWFVQKVGMEWRFIDYVEAHGETLQHYARLLRAKGYVYATHFLPHDARHERLSANNKSVADMLADLLPGERFEVLPQVSDLVSGIQLTRQALAQVWFDAQRCEAGLARLANYRKRFNQRAGAYVNVPDKTNGASEAADALRQFAQALDAGLIGQRPQQKLVRRGSGMVR